jgi:hypothetical protein
VSAFPPLRATAVARPKAGPLGCTAHDRCTGQPVLVDGERGRQCPEHAVTLLPVLAGFPYRPALAADMVDAGHPGAAFDYLAVWLRAEADRRFDEARFRLHPVIPAGTVTAARLNAELVIR